MIHTRSQLRLQKHVIALIAACAVLRAIFDSTYFLMIDVAIAAASIFLLLFLKSPKSGIFEGIIDPTADDIRPLSVTLPPPTDETPFLSAMSHDLRTPLNGILASAKLMQGMDTKGENSEALDIIVRCSKHLDARISDLLDYAALDANTLVARRSIVAIRELICGVSRVTASDAFDTQRGFSLHVDGSVPETVVIDPDRLYQVLDHMLKNVLKTLTRGSIAFSVYADVPNSINPKLHFQVNTVPHPAEEILPNLGQEVASQTNGTSSFQSELEVSSKLTKKLVALLEGELNVAQYPALGSTLTLPLTASEAVTPLPLSPLSPDTAITVFTDDRLMCSLISRMADDIGCGRVTARPLSAFAQELSKIPSSDVVFVDCPATAPSIPTELATIAIPETVRVIPIIPCNNLGALHKLRSSGFSSCLIKPFLTSDFNKLLSSPENAIQPSARSHLSLRILVVDDVRINQVVLTKHLELAGHAVVTASNGSEAIDLLEKAEHFSPSVVRSSGGFDAVIMDINMPVLSGLEATKIIRDKERALRETGLTTHVPIVGVTADVIALDQEDFILAGMEWCLTKPIDPRRLLQLIEHFGRLSLRNLPGQTAPDGAIELSWLRTQFENDEDVVSEILDAFLDEIDHLWLSLFRKVLAKDAEAIRKSAHAIKGSLQNVGARIAAESARLIELAAKQGNLEELDSLIGELAQQVKSAKECAQCMALARVGKAGGDSSHLNLTATIETKG